MRRAGFAALAACATLTAGCGLFGDAAKKPVPLTDFTATVTPVAVWSASVGKAGGYRFRPDGEENAALLPAGNESEIVQGQGSGHEGPPSKKWWGQEPDHNKII